MKNSEFNIEKTYVWNLGRMPYMFSIIMIAYVWYYLVEIYISENINPKKY